MVCLSIVHVLRNDKTLPLLTLCEVRHSLAGMSDPKQKSNSEGLQSLPSIDRLLQSPTGARLVGRFGHGEVVEACREGVAHIRAQIQSGEEIADPVAVILSRAEMVLTALFQPSLQPVLNLTGTVLHTNLGRHRYRQPPWMPLLKFRLVPVILSSI